MDTWPPCSSLSLRFHHWISSMYEMRLSWLTSISSKSAPRMASGVCSAMVQLGVGLATPPSLPTLFHTPCKFTSTAYLCT